MTSEDDSDFEDALEAERVKRQTLDFKKMFVSKEECRG
jgi:hypothetical protein